MHTETEKGKKRLERPLHFKTSKCFIKPEEWTFVLNLGVTQNFELQLYKYNITQTAFNYAFLDTPVLKPLFFFLLIFTYVKFSSRMKELFCWFKELCSPDLIVSNLGMQLQSHCNVTLLTTSFYHVHGKFIILGYHIQLLVGQKQSKTKTRSCAVNIMH